MFNGPIWFIQFIEFRSFRYIWRGYCQTQYMHWNWHICIYSLPLIILRKKLNHSNHTFDTQIILRSSHISPFKYTLPSQLQACDWLNPLWNIKLLSPQGIDTSNRVRFNLITYNYESWILILWKKAIVKQHTNETLLRHTFYFFVFFIMLLVWRMNS